MKKIIVHALTVFLVILFSSCSSSVSTTAIEDKDIREMSWDNYSKPGFFQHENHRYGFDRHPEPKESQAEDTVAYVSVLKGDTGLVKVRIVTDREGFYICDPNDRQSENGHTSYRSEADLDKDAKEQPYAIVRSEEGDSTTALCKETNKGTWIVQKLQVSSYDWKEYGFDVYIFGKESDGSDRHQLTYKPIFWENFDKTFRQTVVKHGELSKKFIPFDKGYVLTRAEGEYGNNECVEGDIGDFIEKIGNYAWDGNGKKRAVVQIGYPAKRFWPLAANASGQIEICGEPKDSPPSSGLVLESLSKSGCEAITEKIDVLNVNGVWKLKFGNGNEVNANTSNVDPKCKVFAEAGTSDKVEEVGDAVAVALSSTIGNGNKTIGVSVALLPWSEEYKDQATHTAIHELGHTMGLKDLNDKPLSCIPDKQYKPNSQTGEIEVCIEGEENNLMHYTANSKEYKLRNRLVKGANGNNKEFESQWKCLQRIDANKNCIKQEVHLMD